MLLATRLFLLCAALLPTTTTYAAELPMPPSELRVLIDPQLQADNYGIRMAWNDNSQNESGFEISDGETIRRVGAQTTFYRWGSMTPGEYKCFKVRSYNDVGSSTWEPNVDPWYRCGTTSKGALLRFDQVNTTNYAGYGAKGKEFVHVAGTWWVPRVECPPFQLQETRAAPWVGLTGNDLTDENTFLIQVGTISHCQLGYVYHKAFWQVYRENGGTTPQILFDVQENDLITAYVSYDQSDGMFYISITDSSQGVSQPRARLNVPGLAGSTVENSRSRALCVVESDSGGLAQFNTPIEWWGCLLDRGSQANRSLWPDKFDMNKECVPPSDPDCKTKRDIAPKAEVSPLDVHDNAFTVKWLRQ